MGQEISYVAAQIEVLGKAVSFSCGKFLYCPAAQTVTRAEQFLKVPVCIQKSFACIHIYHLSAGIFGSRRGAARHLFNY